MPNGGVPMHMILYPKSGEYVLYCRGGELRIIARDAWQREKWAAAPLVTLSSAEGAALAWHLRYWLGEDALHPGYDMRNEVQAEYDF
jgi:hypothetical protein